MLKKELRQTMKAVVSSVGREEVERQSLLLTEKVSSGNPETDLPGLEFPAVRPEQTDLRLREHLGRDHHRRPDPAGPPPTKTSVRTPGRTRDDGQREFSSRGATA